MQYTVLDLKQINGLIGQYDIDKIISCKILSGGSENTNYLISSNTGSYVLTICEQKSIAEAINLSMLLEHLATNDFLTSKIIRNKKNELISSYDNKPVILKSFLKGRIVSDLSDYLLEMIGVQMGKLHKVNAPNYIPKKLNYGMEYFNEVAIYAENSPFDVWLKKIQKQIEPHLTEAIPQALIHGDIFYSNVIISENGEDVTIMDFEEATFYYRIFDVGMAIVGLCREEESVNLEKVANLLKGYRKEIELLDVEKKSLQSFTIYAAAAMSFWRHKNFNYTNPTPGMEDHYLALKNIADFVNELPDDCFKKMID